MASRQRSSRRSHQPNSITNPPITANGDEITDFGKLRENLTNKLELDNWFHLASLQNLHIFNVDMKANGNLCIRNTIHINIKLKCTVYAANDDIIITVKLDHWPQLQSLIEQFGRKVKRECDEFDETYHSDDNKDDCEIDRKDLAVAFEFCARNDVEADSADPKQPLAEIEEISIVKTETIPDDNVHSRRSDVCSERVKTTKSNAKRVSYKGKSKEHFCSKCNETYIGAVDHHMSQRHPNDRQSYECHICCRQYLSLSALRRHIKSRHVGITKKPSKVTIKTRVKCDLCDKDFASKDSLKSHKYRAHNKDKWKQCQICNRAYDNLNRHVKFVHGEESKMVNNVCHICGAAYKQMSGLKKHMETKHTEDGEFFCTICNNGKNYRSKWYLKRHFSVVHAYVEEKGREYSNAFECNLCHERLPSSNTLRHHISQKHNGVVETESQPPRCEFRDEQSGRKESPHNRTNDPTGKAYLCRICGQPFSQPSHLKTHLIQHHEQKEHKNVKNKACSMCDKKYVAVIDLRVHMRRVHGAILPIKTIPNEEMEWNC